MQRTPPQTRSQGPAQHPLDPDLERCQRRSPSDLQSSLESVPGSIRHRGDPVDPMDQFPDSPQAPQRGRSSSTQQANAPFKSDQSAGHEGQAASPAQDEDPTQLFLKLFQTLKTPSSSSPKFFTPGMKPPDKFGSENSSKLRGFLQSYDFKKVLYAALYLGRRGFKTYLDLLKNQSPSCLIKNWDQCEQQLLTLFGDPNEVGNTEFKLNSLSMKDNGKASTYIAQFQTLQSRINWNDAAFAFHFRKGLPSRITNQLALTGQTQELLSRQNMVQQEGRLKPITFKEQRCFEIASVLNKEGQLNSEERARMEREICLYCGGKHELESFVKWIACEAAKLAKK
ncbi:uncharacterized protein VP01_5001g1 [Puccinia sorghi]|uniref:Retrotransposon gag domain-containing protein n=1 Tax=Puccinia sorghi TaxID=27349 RepID=A0A0L6UMG2_9BASI|nr:uncharacterized protein VP01_5001g1 [Puccinia sorghi]